MLSALVLVALGIGFLDAPPRGRIIMRDGEAYHRAVFKLQRALYQPLSEGAPAHDDAAVLVLDGTGEDLRRRGTILIDEHRHGALEELGMAVGVVFTPRSLAPLCIDNHVALAEKLVDDHHSGLQIAPAVVLQVDDEAVHTLALQFLHGRHELLVGGGPEVADADISYARPYHI